jgi:hypothetical protein
VNSVFDSLQIRSNTISAGWFMNNLVALGINYKMKMARKLLLTSILIESAQRETERNHVTYAANYQKTEGHKAETGIKTGRQDSEKFPCLC